MVVGICTNCGKEIMDMITKCPDCGGDVKSSKKKTIKENCYECGTEYVKGTKECPHCECPVA